MPWIYGTPNNDSLWGSEGDDEIYGNLGNDLIRGLGGADRIFAGRGDDDVQGGDGNDWIWGDDQGSSSPGDGADTLEGGAGDDVLQGGGGNDLLLGGVGADGINGDLGDDRIEGGEGNDHLNGVGLSAFGGNGSDVDTLLGGGGDDHIFINHGDTADGGSGADALSIDFYNYGGADGLVVDFRQLTSGGSMIIGGGLITGFEATGDMSLTKNDDKVIAGALRPGLYGIRLDGWGGNDELTGTAGVDNISGGDGDDIIYGLGGLDPSYYPSGDRIRGDAGNDVIHAGDQDTEAMGGTGNDILYGGNGADSIWGEAGNDIILGGGGNDGLDGDDGDDIVTGGAGADYLTGGDGLDTLDYSREDGGGDVYVNMNPYFSGMPGPGPDGYIPIRRALDSHGSLDWIAEFENVVTGAGNDSVYGDWFANRIETGAGNDTLDGGGGADMLIGGTGNDTYWFEPYAGAPTGTIVELAGGGIDEVATTFASFSLAGIAEVENLTGYSNAGGLLAGNGLSNAIRGAGGADTIEGGSGDDELYGNGGNDDLRGGDGDDVLDGGAGNDILDGGDGDDTAYVVGGTTAADTGSDVVRLGFNLAGGGSEAGSDHLIVDYSSLTEAVQFLFPPDYGPQGAMSAVRVGGLDRLSFTGVGRMTLTTGSGSDLVYAIGRDDVIATGAGNDLIHAFQSGGGGRVRIDGGTGLDAAFRVDWSDLNESVFLDLDNPQGVTIGSGESERYLRGIEAVFGFITGSGDDTILFGSDGLLGSSVFTGLGSDSVLVHGGTTHVTTGPVEVNLGAGPGTDTLIANFRAASEAVHYEANAWGSTVSMGGWQRHTYSEVETIFLTTGAANDLLDGRGGNQVSQYLTAGAGDDFLYGGALGDTLEGGIGNDRLEGGGGDDYLHGDGGDDQLLGGSGQDMLTVKGPGIVTADGGAGSDTLVIDYADATTAITMSAPAVDPNGGLSGTIGDGAGRDVTYSGIENFHVETGSGNDVVRGGGGDDYFGLGGGDDVLHLSGGFDYADGGEGIDGLSGTLGAGGVAIIWNLVTGTLGQMPAPYTSFEYFKSLTTGGGQDHITTANIAADDSITLGAGSDGVTLWNGHDIVDGGVAGAGAADSGLDTLILNYGQSTSAVRNVGALTGNGSGYSGQFSDDGTRSATFTAIDRFLIATGSGADAIATGDGNDEIRTGGGNDVVASGGGNDFIDGGSGDDEMAGGTGNDIYVVGAAGDAAIENLGEGTDEVRTALAVYVLAANVENLTATSAAAHDFRGNSGNNVVIGGAGNDVLRLQDGGNDIVNAGAGNDNIFFIGALTAADVVDGGDGVDTLVIQGPYGSLALSANVTRIENVSILGGNNTNFGESGTNRYDYVLTTNDANFAAGVQARINGAALLEGEDFTFDGSAETDAKYVVYGGKGKDTLTGGLGNDIFFYAEERFASGDVVDGGSGYDGMFLRGNYTIDFTAPGYAGLFTSIENLTLTSATDERYARGGGTEFDYNLTLSDAIVKPGEQLTISGTLLMASETMILDASQETDGLLRLFGGQASDTLKGGGQADLLYGGLGADVLAGNGGADAFRFQEVAESNLAGIDRILDFTAGVDKIELDRIDANTLLGGDQAFSWIGSNAFSGQAGQLRAYEQGGTWYVEGDVNGDSVADLVIALTLQGPTPLGAGDFLL